jgi:hypothetical protein
MTQIGKIPNGESLRSGVTFDIEKLTTDQMDQTDDTDLK